MTIESSGAINFNPEFASIATRFAGFLIDSVATVAALAPGIAILAVGSGALRFSGILITMVGLLLVARWYSSSVSTSGQWIGNRVTNTKVVDVTSGDLLDRGRAASRFLVRALISPVLLLGFIFAFTNSQRRSFHDQFAGSIVTRPTRESWSVHDDPSTDNAPDSKSAQ
ncbi:MAG: putative RDD family membrane protein YckC [Minisyncoccia bacterium]|uniref:RDD family protein n=1 Tax=uncultured Ilumatobacter sp. TaxID=879968 RepID=UPI00374F0616